VSCHPLSELGKARPPEAIGRDRGFVQPTNRSTDDFLLVGVITNAGKLTTHFEVH
jgi:hypothetical protein